MSIVWLASYPKSGNTWLRVFLTNYRRDDEQPADINDLEKDGIASSRMLVDTYAGVESSDLTPDEIEAQRPAIYRLLAAESPVTRFIKTHDAYAILPDGYALFPDDITACAVYIIRNPLDVAVSMMAHFNDCTLEQSICRMRNPGAVLSPGGHYLAEQCRHRLGTWSEHVRSWVDLAKGFPVHVVHYEAMQKRPLETFARIVRLVGLPLEPARLTKAVRFSRFDVLQAQETARGFCERTSRTTAFFRRGVTGVWREQLSPAQVAQIVADHGEVMQRFGYLSADGQITY